MTGVLLRAGLCVATAIFMLAGCAPTVAPQSLIIAGERVGNLVWVGMPESELSAIGFQVHIDHPSQTARYYYRTTGRGLVRAVACVATERVFLALISGSHTRYRTPEGFGIGSPARDVISFYTESPAWDIEVLNRRSDRVVTVNAKGKADHQLLFIMSLPRDSNSVVSIGVGIEPTLACPEADL